MSERMRFVAAYALVLGIASAGRGRGRSQWTLLAVA
jgi:hypothetical protein